MADYLNKYSFPIEIYECKITLLIFKNSFSIAQYVNKILKRYNKNFINTYESLDGFAHRKDLTEYFIFLSEESLKNFNTLFHEIFHITNFICRDRNIINDDEAGAYIQGFIGDKITSHLLKNNYCKWK